MPLLAEARDHSRLAPYSIPTPATGASLLKSRETPCASSLRTPLKSSSGSMRNSVKELPALETNQQSPFFHPSGVPALRPEAQKRPVGMEALHLQNHPVAALRTAFVFSQCKCTSRYFYSALVSLSILQIAPQKQIMAILPRSFYNGPYYRFLSTDPPKDCYPRYSSI